MTRGKRIFAAASGAAITLAMSGCGSSTDASSVVHTQHVTKATFTGLWPLTVDGGTIACDVSKGGSITFSPDGTSDVYAENGTAMGGWAKQEGWKDFHDIWLTSDDPGPRVDTRDIDAIGQKLCDDGFGSTAAKSNLATTTTTSAVESQPLAADLDAPLRGFMSKPPLWDETFGAATADQCFAEGFDGLTPVSAWRLIDGGALACAGNPAVGAWDGRVVNLTVFFDPPVDDRTALQQVAAIFPTDAQQSDIGTGHNSSASQNQTGTCAGAVYTSAELGAAVSAVTPSWSGDASKATVTLYSGGNADGSDSVFRAGSVHQALIGLHDGGTDSTGC